MSTKTEIFAFEAFICKVFSPWFPMSQFFNSHKR